MPDASTDLATSRRVLHLAGRGAADRPAFGPGDAVTRVEVTSAGSAARAARGHLRDVGAYDVVVASGRLGLWAVAAGSAVGRGRVPAVASISTDDGAVGGLVRRAGARVVVAPSRAVLRRARLDDGTPTVVATEVATPVHDGSMGSATPQRRAVRDRVRASAGVGSGDWVVLAPGDSTRDAGHGRAVWAVGLLHELDRRSRLLVPGTGDGARAVADLAAKLGRSGVVALARSPDAPAAAPFDARSLALAADAAVFVPTGPVDPAPLLACMAAGVPVVASRSAVAAEWVDGLSAWLVDEVTPRALARRLLDVREAVERDPAGHAARVDAGRAVAARFTPTAHAARWAEALATAVRLRRR